MCGRNKKRQIGGDMSEDPLIQSSQQALILDEQIANNTLDKAVQETADALRVGGKAIAILSDNKAVREEFKNTIIKLADALAIIVENSSDVTATIVEKFGPAFKQYMFAASDVVNGLSFDIPMAALGVIPIFGDAASLAGQIFGTMNRGGWHALLTGYKSLPEVAAVGGEIAMSAERNANVVSETNDQLQKLAVAINDVAASIKKDHVSQKGGRTRRKFRKKHIKKHTKKALKRNVRH